MINIGKTVEAKNLLTTSPPQLGDFRARHLDTGNILFADGHVKSLNVDAVGRVGTIPGAYRLWTIQKD